MALSTNPNTKPTKAGTIHPIPNCENGRYPPIFIIASPLISSNKPAGKDFTKSKGAGLALDFGVTYNPIKSVKLSASLLDLGFIHYSKELHKIKKNEDFRMQKPDMQRILLEINIRTKRRNGFR